MASSCYYQHTARFTTTPLTSLNDMQSLHSFNSWICDDSLPTLALYLRYEAPRSWNKSTRCNPTDWFLLVSAAVMQGVIVTGRLHELDQLQAEAATAVSPENCTYQHSRFRIQELYSPHADAGCAVKCQQWPEISTRDHSIEQQKQHPEWREDRAAATMENNTTPVIYHPWLTHRTLEKLPQRTTDSK